MIGISHTTAGYLFALTDSAGGPVSDYVWVHQFIPAFTVIDFVSDTDLGSLNLPAAPNAIVVETGGLQLVGSYVNDRGEVVTLNVQSDVESIPDSGATAALLGSALLGLAALRRRFGRA